MPLDQRPGQLELIVEREYQLSIDQVRAALRYAAHVAAHLPLGGAPGIVRVLLDEIFPLAFWHDNDFLTSPPTVATFVISRVSQSRPISERVAIWTAALDDGIWQPFPGRG